MHPLSNQNLLILSSSIHRPRVGIKLPPYTYSTQFSQVTSALRDARSSEPSEGCVVDFITCTNTLGSSLVLVKDSAAGEKDATYKPAVNSEAGTGIGGKSLYLYVE
jgi:hypothetical protein